MLAYSIVSGTVLFHNIQNHLALSKLLSQGNAWMRFYKLMMTITWLLTCCCGLGGSGQRQAGPGMIKLRYQLEHLLVSKDEQHVTSKTLQGVDITKVAPKGRASVSLI